LGAGVAAGANASGAGPAAKPARKYAKPRIDPRTRQPLGASGEGVAEAPPPPARGPQRPASLADVVGHERAKGLLSEAISRGRVHHAWIFHGPMGVGKFTAALAFAAELLTPPADDPQHDSVRSMLRAGTHPDLHVVTKELARISRETDIRSRKLITIPKDVIDEFLLEPITRSRSVECDSRASRVFIVDEAELLDRSPTNAPTQNSMLKTLEEPPPGAVIILVCSDEQRLLVTIRSRCQRVGFSPLEPEQTAMVLSRLNEPATGPVGQWVLGFCEGSPGLAQLALKQGLFAWHQALGPVLGVVLENPGSAVELGTLCAGLVEERAKAIVDADGQASKEAANRFWAKRMLAFMATAFRAQMVQASSTLKADRCADAIDLCARAEGYLDNNVQHPFVFDDLAAQLMAGVAPLPGEP
jgi:DNA polymerase III subunit delta'